MHVLYLAGRELDYPRNDVLLRAFQRLGTVEVIGERGIGSLFWRSLRGTLRALPRLLTNHYDLIFVGFYGHFLMLPVGLLSRWPVLFDAFVSTYDTMCFDRNLFGPDSWKGRLAFWLDRTTCNLANCVLLDTQHHADYFAATFNLSSDRLKVLPVGCNEATFYPRPAGPTGQVTLVLYYTTYLPLHGVETVIRAAALLKTEAIRFKIIGRGQEYNRVQNLVNALNLNNITFVPFVPLEKLSDEIAAADICLGGHFGQSSKAGRVVPGKIYQILAMARPLIATTTPANQALLTHAETAYLCPPADPEALASAIRQLHQAPALRDHLAKTGHNLYLSQCSETVITQHLHEIITPMMGGRG